MEIKRDNNGRFIKGIIPKTCFKKGDVSLRKGIKIPKDSETYKRMQLSGTWFNQKECNENHRGWKGGTDDYFRKHARILMNQQLKRKLLTVEIVHHIDQNPKNNDISNLYLFKNHKEHMSHHKNLRNIVKKYY